MSLRIKKKSPTVVETSIGRIRVEPLSIDSAISAGKFIEDNEHSIEADDLARWLMPLIAGYESGEKLSEEDIRALAEADLDAFARVIVEQEEGRVDESASPVERLMVIVRRYHDNVAQVGRDFRDIAKALRFDFRGSRLLDENTIAALNNQIRLGQELRDIISQPEVPEVTIKPPPEPPIDLQPHPAHESNEYLGEIRELSREQASLVASLNDLMLKMTVQFRESDQRNQRISNWMLRVAVFSVIVSAIFSAASAYLSWQQLAVMEMEQSSVTEAEAPWPAVREESAVKRGEAAEKKVPLREPGTSEQPTRPESPQADSTQSEHE